MTISVENFDYICAAIILITTIIGSAGPIFVTAPKWTARLESLAGGVFLGGGLAHLLADATEELADRIKYPLAPAVTSLVFVLFTLVELFSYSEHDAAVFAEQHHHDNYETLHSEKLLSADSAVPRRRIVEFGKNMSGFDAATVSLYIIMGIHSTIEGLALGVLEKWSDVIAILCAIVAHKPVEAFALGLILIKRKPTPLAFGLMIALYSVLSPIGVVSGSQLRESRNGIVIGIIEAFSAGAFLFIGCHEW
jgi:zinc transporter 1/2/3